MSFLPETCAACGTPSDPRIQVRRLPRGIFQRIAGLFTGRYARIPVCSIECTRVILRIEGAHQVVAVGWTRTQSRERP